MLPNERAYREVKVFYIKIYGYILSKESVPSMKKKRPFSLFNLTSVFTTVEKSVNSSLKFPEISKLLSFE